MYQPVPPYTDPVPPSTNLYRTWTAPGQLKTGNVAWGLQTSAQFTPGLVLLIWAHFCTFLFIFAPFAHFFSFLLIFDPLGSCRPTP